ncbi:MAG TPA: hypothetical protein DCR00_01890 [Gammaproteobacteria bacterium]|nr:hypothetical protein [Gammaproteobacteria bacterium]
MRCHFARYRGGCNAIGSHTTRKSEFSHFRQIAAIAASQTGQSNNFSAGETRQTLKPEENKAPRATHRFWIDLAQLLLSNLHSMVCYSYFLPISRTATA